MPGTLLVQAEQLLELLVAARAAAQTQSSPLRAELVSKVHETQSKLVEGAWVGG